MQDKEANQLKKFFQKIQRYDVAYLQLRVELHLSWAFFNQLFDTLSFLNNVCEIVHFQKGGDWSP